MALLFTTLPNTIKTTENFNKNPNSKPPTKQHTDPTNPKQPQFSKKPYTCALGNVSQN